MLQRCWPLDAYAPDCLRVRPRHFGRALRLCELCRPRCRATRRAQPVQQRLAYGKPTIAAVGITRPDGGVDSVSTEIEVQDLLIAGMGDSVAAGEGNPDRPIALADEGFCYRRFLGAARGEYFRPSRLGYKSDKACDDDPAGSAASTADWNSHGARWMSAACHRSLYGYPLRTALAI